MHLKVRILRSCHATLIHLGDLSRYRELELNQKQRNWGPAKGYYDLATALDPASGETFNQLAVISIEDKDRFRAVYYIYRALCSQKPPPQALGNLGVVLPKLLKHHQRGEPIITTEQLPGISNALVTSLLVYHAACYTDPNFSDHEEQREALLAQFATEVKTKPFDSALRKMCLINIAASSQAIEQTDDLGEAGKAKTSTLRSNLVKTQYLNVGTFLVLLDLLSEELRAVKQGNAELSPCTRRLLPLLRLYSGWLLSNVHYLLEDHFGHDAIPQAFKFWSTYAEALNLVIAAFAIKNLPQVSHLLDEDQDTLNFRPFSALVREIHFEGPTGTLKPSRDAGTPEDPRPEDEMYFRIRELVRVGVHLRQHKAGRPQSTMWLTDNSLQDDFSHISVPLDYVGGQFQCTIVDPSQLLSQQLESCYILGVIPNSSHHNSTSTQAAGPTFHTREVDDPVRSDIELTRSSNSQPSSPSLRAPTQRADSRPTSSTFTAHDLVRQIQQPSPTPGLGTNGHASHRTSLPSIFQTPFTPLPGEIPDSGSRPGTAHQVLSPSTAPVPPSRGTVEFQQQLVQMQHNIKARTSPVASLEPTQTSYYETPTGLNTFIRHQPDSSPWERSMTTPSVQDTEIPKKAPRASPFGAIGEARPKSAKTPTSGQPG